MANIWARFKKLIADPPVMIGTVTLLNADGSTTVTMLGNGVVKVLGQPVPTVGKTVFVQGHEIIGEAPSLPAYSADV